MSISKIDKRITVEYLIEKVEGQYFERKGIEESGLKPTKLANEIIGMLNADGGIIVVGVSEQDGVQDLKTMNTNLIDRYRKICFDFIAPPANVELEEVILDSGELLFIYHIEQDYERVFCRKDNEDVYIRIGDSNKGPLTREEVRKLEYDREIRSFEDEPRKDFDTNDFEEKTLEFYKKQLKFEGDYKELLLSRNLAIRDGNEVVYKNSAVLLFAKNPDKYIPSSCARYIRYDGVVAKTGVDHNVIKDERFEGCIPLLARDLQKFIYASLRDYYYLDVEKGRFVKISEYPEEAWLEGLVNALCHRSYNVQGNCIYIKHFDDRLEISNSGPLPAQVTVENIREERFSRNPRVARVLSDLGLVRELNEGVSRIFESMEKSMLAEPKYYDRNNTVTLILRNKIADHEKAIPEIVMKKVESMWKHLNETEIEILSYILASNGATVGQLSISLSKSDKVIRGYLNKFCLMDVLEKNTTKKRDINALYSIKRS